jgi:outer membrane protein assembly factor BamB
MRCKVRYASIILLVSSVLCACADDWPHWRGPEFNGISREKNWSASWPKSGPPQLWKASVGMGFSSVSIANGRLFTMGNHDGQDTVYCFHGEKGSFVWKHSYPCPLDPRFYEGGTLSTPTVDGDRVYTISKRGDIFCFDAATGKILWQKNLIKELALALPANDQDNWWGFAGSPLVRGDSLLLNVGSNGTALDKKSGEVLWSNGRGFAGYSTPLPFMRNGQEFVAMAGADSIFSVGVSDGKVLWRYPWKTAYNVNAPDPVIRGDKFFVSSYRHGCALLEIKGDGVEKIYENRNLNNHLSPGVLIGDFLYGIDGDAGYAGGVTCLDFATGALKWNEKSAGTGALMAADGKLIILSAKGELMIAEATPTAFKPIARAQVLGGKCWTVPVLSNGRIYCRNSKGDLVCVDVRGGQVRREK